jgi:hypothetical protein
MVDLFYKDIHFFISVGKVGLSIDMITTALRNAKQ